MSKHFGHISIHTSVFNTELLQADTRVCRLCWFIRVHVSRIACAAVMLTHTESTHRNHVLALLYVLRCSNLKQAAFEFLREKIMLTWYVLRTHFLISTHTPTFPDVESQTRSRTDNAYRTDLHVACVACSHRSHRRYNVHTKTTTQARRSPESGHKHTRPQRTQSTPNNAHSQPPTTHTVNPQQRTQSTPIF